MKKNSFFSILCFCFVLVLSSNLLQASSLFGLSGGIKNESSFPIKIKVINESGDYQWVIIAQGSSYDFPDGTNSVLFVRYTDEIALRQQKYAEVRVLLTHRDGKNSYLEKENAQYFV